MEDKTVTQQLLQLRTLSKASCIRKFIELYGYEPKQTKNVPALRARLAFRVQELHYGGIADSTRQKINEYADKDLSCASPNVGGSTSVNTKTTRQAAIAAMTSKSLLKSIKSRIVFLFRKAYLRFFQLFFLPISFSVRSVP